MPQGRLSWRALAPRSQPNVRRTNTGGQSAIRPQSRTIDEGDLVHAPAGRVRVDASAPNQAELLASEWTGLTEFGCLSYTIFSLGLRRLHWARS